ncbi:MAG: glycosyltransferase [Paracoccus sp. (in: a-proteobacteria)]|nr:glycosyltransferase [Paracoccus sp. (in: a-proteobacteria)]
MIVGMHRSGTSFLTDCLGAMGFALPADRGGPAPDNANGHFEPQGIVALNDQILAGAGANLLRLGPLHVPLDDDMAARMAQAMADSFGDDSHIALKDPRISILMEPWCDWLRGEGASVLAIVALRDPREVAQSLARRDDTPQGFAMLVWLNYTLSALRGSADLPHRLVLFPDWTATPQPVLRDIAEMAGLDHADLATIAQRFDRDQVHAQAAPFTGSDDPAETLAMAVFARLADLARSGGWPEAQELRDWQAAFAPLAAAHAEFEQAYAAHLRQAGQMLRDTTEQRDASIAQAQIQARSAQLLQETLTATEAQRDELQRLADAHHLNTLALQDELDQMQDRLAQAGASGLAARQIARKIYRRGYHFAGGHLRRFVPHEMVERIKRFVPGPGGVPAALAHAPLPETPRNLVAFDAIRRNDEGADRPDIFILSIINWDFRTQRPQHLASEMARAGHRVFYIEMERDQSGGSAREVAPNVWVIRLSNRGLRALANYTGQPSGTQARIWLDHFHAMSDAVGASPVAHVVIEHPYWWHFARHLAPQYRLTFDCMDEISGFANTEAHILDAEAEMIERADRMIVSSQYLFDKYSPQRPVALIRNGTDVSHFTGPDTGEIPAFLQGKLQEGRIRVGYVGAIAEWFDVGLLDELARDNPDFDIHLCGAVSATEPLLLRAHPNVTFHGEIAYAQVPDFLRAMDVLIIPFRLDPIILACDPVKFYEYSAVQRPTVATALPELARAGDLVATGSDAAGFAAAIRKAAPLARDPDHGARLRQYALDNAWSYRAADMLTEMTRAPRLSVIVLGYGDPALTLETLRSLVAIGEVYPDLEVILSDNGSAEDALTPIREMAARYPQIRLIENGENLGFARGNNVGIRAATGDYVLLLNNDTFVAPGALFAMVDHLERNPELGIVGPLTNNIGNEAKVDLVYADMDAMARAARELATGYRGQVSPMPVAAYFAAMFRRADLERVGLLPEIYGRGMFEDDDHCAMFRAAGFEIGLAEDAFVHHHLSATFNAIPSAEKQALFARNKALFEERWGEWQPHRYRTTRPQGSLPERK